MIDQQLDIPTKDGACTTYIVHPDRGGPHPVIIFFMDAPGIREELREMARRIAAVGYYVMLPNLYYRSGVMELGPLPADPEAPERKRMLDLMHTLTIPLVMEDMRALLVHADADKAARAGSVGTVGYCMSGRYALSAAVHFSERVTAAASMYGTYLVTDEADSPHVTLRQAKARIYVACAETDRWAPMEMVDQLKDALLGSDLDIEIEVYPGTQHGFAFHRRGAVYDQSAAERHWQRIFELFRSVG
jgi:carboxymethylenebutenolidase